MPLSTIACVAKRLLPVAVALPAAVAFFVLTASARFPLDGDAVFFLPAAESFAKGSGLVNRYYEPTFAYSPANDGRLIWHGFMAQMLLGLLAQPNDYIGVLKALAFLGFASVMIWALAARKMLADLVSPLWQQTLLIFAGSWAISGYLFNSGRPEPVALLWVSLGCFFIAYTRVGIVRASLAGIVLALVALTSPAAAIFCALGYGIFVARTVSPCRWGAMTVASAVTAIVTLVAGFTFYPYSFEEWIAGLQQHAANVIVDFVGARRLYYWFVAAPMLGGVAAISAAAALFWIWRAHDALQKMAALVCILLLALVCWRIAPGARNYNLLPFVPAAILPVFCALSIGQQHIRCQRMLLVSLSLAVSAVVCLGGSGLARSLLIANAPSDRVTLAAAREAVGQIPADQSVAVTSGLFTALPPESHASVVRNTLIMEGSEVPVSTDWLFVQQINPARTDPPVLPGYELAVHKFSRQVPSLFGFAIANSPRGYNYALYKRSHGASP
jgi:hypothetical protein